LIAPITSIAAAEPAVASAATANIYILIGAMTLLFSLLAGCVFLLSRQIRRAFQSRIQDEFDILDDVSCGAPACSLWPLTYLHACMQKPEDALLDEFAGEAVHEM
jgi:hypothetical protein